MRIPLLMFQIWMWGVPIWGLCALGYLLFSVIKDSLSFKKEQKAEGKTQENE